MSTYRARDFIAAAAAVAIAATLSAPVLGAQAPSYAAAVGYTDNTFTSNFSNSSVDTSGTGKDGFLWYPWNFYGHHANTSAISLNSDGSVTLSGDTTGPNGELTSAFTAKNPAKFVGTAFGGGAYIEAEFKFDPNDVARANSKGWPSFWTLPLEDTALGGSQWPGQPAGYRHSVEADIFEYLYLPYNVPRNIYGAGMHDWYGVPNVTCPKGLCAQHMDLKDTKHATPPGTDFTQYHRYGFLWVPATDSKQGYARFYFDGQSMGADQRWTKFADQPPPPTSQSWSFGRLDQQHLVLILGTGVGEPMTVRSVNVWQASNAGNLHQ